MFPFAAVVYFQYQSGGVTNKNGRPQKNPQTLEPWPIKNEKQKQDTRNSLHQKTVVVDAIKKEQRGFRQKHMQYTKKNIVKATTNAGQVSRREKEIN